MLARIMESIHFAPTCGEPARWVEGKLNKGTMAPVRTYVLWESCPNSWCYSSCLEVSPFSFPTYIPGAFQATDPILELRVSLWASEFECGPFKSKTSIFCNPFPLSDAILTGFHSQMLCGLLFSALESWAWEPGVWLRPLTPQGDLQAYIYFRFLNCHTCPVCISTFPTHLDVASPLYPSL